MRTVALLTLLICSAQAALAAEPEVSDVATEIRRLNATMLEVVKRLDQQIALERTGLISKRIDSEQQHLMALEERLKSLKVEATAIEGERADRERSMKEWGRQLERSPSDAAAAQIKDLLADGEGALKRLDVRESDRAENEGNVESDIAEARRRLSALRAALEPEVLPSRRLKPQ